MTEPERDEAAQGHMREARNVAAQVFERMRTLERDNDELRQQVNGLIELNTRMNHLLNGIAFALYGPRQTPYYPWEGLPEVAQATMNRAIKQERIIDDLENQLRGTHGN